ncbi:hypothetical protein Tco_1481305 [Tanacetum coccineum]
MEIIPDEEEVAIDAIPLAVKSPSIIGWKIYKEGRKSYYQIIKANGKSQMYMIFSQMLKSFDREDLEDLYKLVKAKYKSTRLVEDLDLLLWSDSKTMFEPHVEDKCKRSTKGSDTWNATLAIHVLIKYQSNGHKMDPMISKDSRDEINSKGVYKESLDHSSQAYK